MSCSIPHYFSFLESEIICICNEKYVIAQKLNNRSKQFFYSKLEAVTVHISC